MFLLLIGIFATIFILEVPQLIKMGYYREIAVFMFFFIAGVYMSLSRFFDWPLYNPLKLLIDLAAS